ncbi:hypothetical protein MTO96_038897 [Rhipicephalus appendiculatus]
MPDFDHVVIAATRNSGGGLGRSPGDLKILRCVLPTGLCVVVKSLPPGTTAWILDDLLRVPTLSLWHSVVFRGGLEKL